MRYRDWTQRLTAAIQAASARPFSWAEHSCCHFVGDCCLAVCGVDPAEDYRGRFTTERGAYRVLSRGHGSIAAVLDAYFERVSPSCTQRGDVVQFEGDTGETVGVIWAGAIWSAGPGGVGRVVSAVPHTAWRVS